MTDEQKRHWLKDIILPSLQALTIGGAIMWGGFTFLIEQRALAKDVQAINVRVDKLYDLLIYPTVGK